MPKVKVPRKSTSIDMTAMCDVAFLLLSFFILATQFKPEEALQVVTPKSVSTKPLEGKDIVMITMDKEGKVYFSIDDRNKDEKRAIIEEVNTQKGLNLTENEMKAFERGGSFVGVPFAQLKSYLQLEPEQIKNFKQPGIPVTDTLNNELQVWMRAAVGAFSRGATGKMNILVKGDNDAKFPSFKGVIEAFKKNEQFKFSMVTDPEGIPPGTELARKAAAVAAGGKPVTD